MNVKHIDEINMKKQLAVVTLALALVVPAIGYAMTDHEHQFRTTDYLDLPLVTEHEQVTQTIAGQEDYSGLSVVITQEEKEPAELEFNYVY